MKVSNNSNVPVLETLQDGVIKFGLNTVNSLPADQGTTGQILKIGETDGVLEWADSADAELLTEITYAELKELRDNAELIPGMKYRITDYHCTTYQKHTRSIDHQFDIIVTADDEKTLNEDAKAVKHQFEEALPYVTCEVWDYYGEEEYHIFNFYRYAEGDTLAEGPIYCWKANETISGLQTGEVYNPVLYSTTEDIEDIEELIAAYRRVSILGEDYDLGYVEFTGEEEFDPVYADAKSDGSDYFSGSKLEAWELKYTIDCDHNRFFWAPNNEPTERIEEFEFGEVEGKFVRQEGQVKEITHGEGTEAILYGTMYTNGDKQVLLLDMAELDGEYMTIPESMKPCPIVKTLNAPFLWDGDWRSYNRLDNSAGEIEIEYNESLYTRSLSDDKITTIDLISSESPYTWYAYKNTTGELIYFYDEDPRLGEEFDPLFIEDDFCSEFNLLSAFETYDPTTILHDIVSVEVPAQEGPFYGTVYYMKDEFRNECPYDFKNIQFNGDVEFDPFEVFGGGADEPIEVTSVLPMAEAPKARKALAYSSNEEEGFWIYTFSGDLSYVEQSDKPEPAPTSLPESFPEMGDTSCYSAFDVHDNKIKASFLCETELEFSQGDDYIDERRLYSLTDKNFKSVKSSQALFPNSIEGPNINNVSIGSLSYDNLLRNNGKYDEITNVIIGDNCRLNTFTGSGWNTHTCKDIIVGNGSYENEFYGSLQDVKVGSECYDNTIGDSYSNRTIITLGNHCNNNFVGGSLISLDDYCTYNSIYGYHNHLGHHCDSNKMTDSYCNNNTLGCQCSGNTFDYSCNGNTFTNSSNNNLGQYSQYNTFINSNGNLIAYSRYPRVDSKYNIFIDTNNSHFYGFAYNKVIGYNDDSRTIPSGTQHEVIVLDDTIKADKEIISYTDVECADRNTLAITHKLSNKTELKECTFSELGQLINRQQLHPGWQYMITDYKCTSSDPRAVGDLSNTFKILLTATSTSAVSSDGIALSESGEEYRIKFSMYSNGLGWGGGQASDIVFPNHVEFYNLNNNSGTSGMMCVGKGLVMHARSNSNSPLHVYDYINQIDYPTVKYVSYGNRIFYIPIFDIFVSTCPGVMGYSYDGLTWTLTANPPSDFMEGIYSSLLYIVGDDRCVMLGGNYVAITYDGINWQFNPAPTSLEGWAYPLTRLPDFGHDDLDRQVFLFHMGGNKFIVSNDGITWESYTVSSTYLSTSAERLGIAYGLGKFVIVTDNNYVGHSVDGRTWTFTKIEGYTGGIMKAIVYYKDRFIGIKGGDSYKNSSALYSFDGLIWLPYADTSHAYDLLIIDEYDYLWTHLPDTTANWGYNIYQYDSSYSIGGTPKFYGAITYMEDNKGNSASFDFINMKFTGDEFPALDETRGCLIGYCFDENQVQQLPCVVLASGANNVHVDNNVSDMIFTGDLNNVHVHSLVSNDEGQFEIPEHVGTVDIYPNTSKTIIV